MVFEGILIHKVPYKERDLIVKLLLRNGTQGSFYVYGGQGGGKHHKPTIFEVGSMIKITIRDHKSKIQEQELMVASESQRTWEPIHVRHNIQAYYLVCLYFEIVQKFAQHFRLSESQYDDREHESIFVVLSNAIFYANDSLDKKQFEVSQHLTLFMIKLLYHLGIMPETDNCSHCGADLMQENHISFLAQEGQFSCVNCVNTPENQKGFLLRIKKSYQTKYQDYRELTGASFQEADKLIQFFCHHFQLRPLDLKSYSILNR